MSIGVALVKASNFGDKVGVTVHLQASQNENDQLAIAENMRSQGDKLQLVSPETDSNCRSRRKAGASAINVNDAVVPSTKNYIGNVQKDNGVRAVRWFIATRKNGGKLAVTEGTAGVYALVEAIAVKLTDDVTLARH
jgi:ribose transport system substrate-binding protein